MRQVDRRINVEEDGPTIPTNLTKRRLGWQAWQAASSKGPLSGNKRRHWSAHPWLAYGLFPGLLFQSGPLTQIPEELLTRGVITNAWRR